MVIKYKLIETKFIPKKAIFIRYWNKSYYYLYKDILLVKINF